MENKLQSNILTHSFLLKFYSHQAKSNFLNIIMSTFYKIEYIKYATSYSYLRITMHYIYKIEITHKSIK
jgi:hypothetical protein